MQALEPFFKPLSAYFSAARVCLSTPNTIALMTIDYQIIFNRAMDALFKSCDKNGKLLYSSGSKELYDLVRKAAQVEIESFLESLKRDSVIESYEVILNHGLNSDDTIPYNMLFFGVWVTYPTKDKIGVVWCNHSLFKLYIANSFAYQSPSMAEPQYYRSSSHAPMPKPPWVNVETEVQELTEEEAKEFDARTSNMSPEEKQRELSKAFDEKYAKEKGKTVH